MDTAPTEPSVIVTHELVPLYVAYPVFCVSVVHGRLVSLSLIISVILPVIQLILSTYSSLQVG
jgi:hypothetical protein